MIRSGGPSFFAPDQRAVWTVMSSKSASRSMLSSGSSGRPGPRILHLSPAFPTPIGLDATALYPKGKRGGLCAVHADAGDALTTEARIRDDRKPARPAAGTDGAAVFGFRSRLTTCESASGVRIDRSSTSSLIPWVRLSKNPMLSATWRKSAQSQIKPHRVKHAQHGSLR